jgi:hypothetical protein
MGWIDLRRGGSAGVLLCVEGEMEETVSRKQKAKRKKQKAKSKKQKGECVISLYPEIVEFRAREVIAKEFTDNSLLTS